MTKQNSDARLERMFRDAETAFESDGDQFTQLVGKRVQRSKHVRRLTLSLFAMIGGAFAVFQMPAVIGLLDGFVGLDGQINSAVDDILLEPLNTDFEWFAAFVIGLGTFFIVFAVEPN